jgi:hypothetical protein
MYTYPYIPPPLRLRRLVRLLAARPLTPWRDSAQRRGRESRDRMDGGRQLTSALDCVGGSYRLGYVAGYELRATGYWGDI